MAQEYDAIVIGGGPAGITASLYLLRAGANLAWVEKLAPGGQMLLTDWIDNYPGFPQGINGFELVELMAKHLESYSYDKYTEEVRGLEPQEGANRVLVGDKWFKSKAVIICSGAEHKKLGLPGEEDFTGRGVSYCAVCDGQFFRNQTIACIGGGNTALQEALYLSGLAQKVYLIHRRDEFRGTKIYQDKVLKTENIEILMDTIPKEIEGENQVKALKLENCKTMEKTDLLVDGVFIFVGIKPQTEYLPDSIEKDPWGFVVTDTEMRTNLPGIFAAGDVRSKRCWQIATAVGDGAAAGHSAHIYLEEM